MARVYTSEPCVVQVSHGSKVKSWLQFFFFFLVTLSCVLHSSLLHSSFSMLLEVSLIKTRSKTTAAFIEALSDTGLQYLKVSLEVVRADAAKFLFSEFNTIYVEKCGSCVFFFFFFPLFVTSFGLNAGLPTQSLIWKPAKGS